MRLRDLELFGLMQAISNLKPETSIQIDGEVALNTGSIDATLSPFYNTINNYIYQRNLNNEKKQYGNQWFPSLPVCARQFAVERL